MTRLQHSGQRLLQLQSDGFESTAQAFDPANDFRRISSWHDTEAFKLTGQPITIGLNPMHLGMLKQDVKGLGGSLS